MTRRRVPFSEQPRVDLLLLAGTELSEPLPRSLALDGAYRGFRHEPALDFVSLDHHDGCTRFITRSSCEQVRDAVRLHGDFLDRFEQVVINDLDGDTLMGLYLLHPNRRALVCGEGNAEHSLRLAHLVEAVGLTDALGPLATARLPPEQARLARLYFQGIHRKLGVPERDRPQHFEAWPGWIEAGMGFIDALLDGSHDGPLEEPARPTWRLLARGPHHVIAETQSPNTMAALYEEGHHVVVICTPERPDGTRQYTLGKPSDLVPGDLRAALDALARREPGWGGGSCIGGSPRRGGSRLTVGELQALLEETLGFG